MSARPFPALLDRLPAGGRDAAGSFRLSVVVPAYNERHVVAASLRRVLALRHPLIRELEVIAVDDHSTDGTGEVLQALPARAQGGRGAADFRDQQGEFDTALIVNVLEHVEAEQQTLRNLHSALQPGGRVVVLVPQHAGLMGSLDLALGHLRRYDPARLGAALTEAGFAVERMFDFNRASVPGWWLNGRVLRRKRFSRLQLKLLDTAMPLLSRVDRLWPWKGLSLIAVARKA